MRITLLVTALASLVGVACSSSGSGGSAFSGGGDAGGAPSANGNDAAPASASESDAGGAPVASDASSPEDASAGDDACPAVPAGSPHSIIGNLALTASGDAGVPFGTQNGSVVDITAANLVGKTLVWATAPGGEQIANLPVPTEFGTTTVGADLTAHFTTSAKYTNGPWELAVYVSVTGGDITKGPQPGDIAAFSLTPPPACQPPLTGVSIRVTIDDADATVNLDNSSFIQF